MNNFGIIIISVVSVVIIQILCDYYVYGELIFPIYNNFIFNIYEQKSKNWGVLPFYYYFLTAIPLLLDAYIPFFL
jgi:hypothetical protein